MRRYSSGWPRVGLPPTITLPEEGARKPAIMCRMVDLPAPLGPSRPVMPPSSPKVTSLTATTLPYQREALATSTVGASSEGAGTDAASLTRPPGGSATGPRRR